MSQQRGGVRGAESHAPNVIQVSLRTRSVFFYADLTKSYLRDNDEVIVSGLGTAVTGVVSIVEILKKAEAVIVTKIETALQPAADDAHKDKPKISITVRRGPKYDEVLKELEARRAARLQKDAAASSSSSAAAAAAGAGGTAN